MRINIYSQEITSEIQTETKTSNTGLVYSAVRILLHSSEKLHHPPADDDRSAVTFWLPRSPDRREELALTFEAMAAAVRKAPAEIPIPQQRTCPLCKNAPHASGCVPQRSF